MEKGKKLFGKQKKINTVRLGICSVALIAAIGTTVALCNSCEAKGYEGQTVTPEYTTAAETTMTPVDLPEVVIGDPEEKFDSYDLVNEAKEYKNYLDEQGNKMNEEMKRNGVETDMGNTITEQDLYSLAFTANIENIDSEERNKMIELGLISKDAETIKTQTDSAISYIMSSNVAYVSVSETLEKDVNTDLLISLENLFTDEKDAENAKTLHQNYVNMIGKDKDTIVSSYMNTRDFINYSTRTSYPYSIHEDTIGARYLLRTVYGVENLTYSTDYLPQIERDEFQKSVLNADEFIGYLYDLCGNDYSNEKQKELVK